MVYNLTIPASVRIVYPANFVKGRTGIEIIAEWSGLEKAADSHSGMQNFIQERASIESKFEVEKPSNTTF